MDIQTYQELKKEIKIAARHFKVDFTNDGTFDAKVFSPRIMFDLLAAICHNRAFSDSHPQYSFDSNFRALPFTGRDYCWLNKKGLNDSHIETALAKIQREIA